MALCLVTAGVFAQESPPPAKKIKYRKAMPVQLELGTGINNSAFIDFATSPLYYSGGLITMMGAIRKETAKREVFYSVAYGTGSYSMNYNDITLSSTALANVSFRYSRLYQVNVFNNNAWNLKAGGTIDAALLVRINPGLMNNALGYDAFTNLFISGKIGRDISNREQHKWWFIKIKPKERRLNYQLDLGVINGAFRNDFIYANSSPVYNDANIFYGHSYKLFSGYRMSSRFDYEFAIFNRNTLKVSYLWDAMMSGKENQDRLQLVNKTLLVSLNVKIR